VIEKVKKNKDSVPCEGMEKGVQKDVSTNYMDDYTFKLTVSDFFVRGEGYEMIYEYSYASLSELLDGFFEDYKNSIALIE